MEILIVDDDSSRAQRIEEAVSARGVEANFMYAKSASSARERLNRTSFDVLIIDIALPRFDGEKPDQFGGIEVLKEVTTSSIYRTPTYILGITAHDELRGDAQRAFQERLWQLIYARPNSSSWLIKLADFIEHAKKASIHSATRSYECDICIVTALKVPELQAVLDLEWEWSPAIPLDESTFYHRGTLDTGDGRCSVICSSALSMGIIPSTILVSKLVVAFRPRILIMAGICAGIRGEVNLGDPIVGVETWCWDTGKWLNSLAGGNSKFLPDVKSYTIDQSLLASLKELSGEEVSAAVRSNWRGNAPNTALSMHFGTIATGSTVIADEEMVSAICGRKRKTIAIEMEAYAVHAAAEAFGAPKPKVIVIKSACDFADSEKNDGWQSYAAFTSAQLVASWLYKFAGHLLR